MEYIVEDVISKDTAEFVGVFRDKIEVDRYISHSSGNPDYGTDGINIISVNENEKEQYFIAQVKIASGALGELGGNELIFEEDAIVSRVTHMENASGMVLLPMFMDGFK